MKLIVSLSTTFIFFFCIVVGLSNGQTTNNVSPELAVARAKYDTPFIKKYRKYYEANKNGLVQLIISCMWRECKQKCSDNDRKTIKKLADSGDQLALSILPLFYLEEVAKYDDKSDGLNKYRELVKSSADKGSPYSASHYALLMASIDYKVAERYASMATKSEGFDSYSMFEKISYIYDDKSFCSILKKGYQKFGLEFLAYRMLNTGHAIEGCTKKTIPQILAGAGREGKLINGYIKVKNKDFQGAYDIFSNLYSPNDNSKISANAGYCLGMMNYYGKGTQQDKAKGEKLLKESFNDGVYNLQYPERNNYLLSNILEIRSYYSENCSSIN